MGYWFFICLGLLKKCRPVVWEGESRVDLIETFAPWALPSCTRECAVECVCCCMIACSSGLAEMRPVSEECPLHECCHFVAACWIPGRMDCQGSPLQAFYSRRGMCLLGTVMDGDCGPDVACMMLGLPQAFTNRRTLREDLELLIVSVVYRY